jgi:hypothetical protein
VGFVGLIGHLPGALLFEALNRVAHVPDSFGTGFAIVAQAVLFSALVYWMGARRRAGASGRAS